MFYLTTPWLVWLCGAPLLPVCPLSVPPHCCAGVNPPRPKCGYLFVLQLLLKQQLEPPPQVQTQLGGYRRCNKTLKCPSTSVLHVCPFVLTLPCLTELLHTVSAGKADYSCLCPACFFWYLQTGVYLLMCSCTTLFCISSPVTPADRSRFPFTTALPFHFSMTALASDTQPHCHQGM